MEETAEKIKRNIIWTHTTYTEVILKTHTSRNAVQETLLTERKTLSIIRIRQFEERLIIISYRCRVPLSIFNLMLRKFLGT